MGKNHADQKLAITLPSNTRHLHAMGLLTKTLAESMGFATRDSEKTALAVEEALTNVIEHAYHGQEGRKMHVIFELKGQQFVVRIQHNGDQIDNNSGSSDSDFSHFYKQKKKGGLGVLIMKKCMDEVIYKHGPKQNECCMIKYLKK